jgi:photosystem II stability/assembly factor-like uncharacterized protein
LRNLRSLSVWTALLLCMAAVAPARALAQGPADRSLAKTFEGLKFRCIGPYRGGRVTAVAGVRGEPFVAYQGATGGGVWRTTDGGATWQPVSDKFFKTGSVGAIAVAESDPNVVYVGMGETPIRGNVSHGDGMYKSTDRGRTWTHLGLAETRQIGRVAVHPKDPNLVYVAAQGHVWGPNQERGVYRSKDGGKTWERVLFVNDLTGASDLAMDPTNPRILYAGFWEVYRKPWALVSGGKNGGLYRSTDGGDTWKKLTEGLPEGVVGKIGVSVSAANPDRIYAMVEAEKGGLFVSTDGGEKWSLISSDNRLRQRAWYYSEVYADPKSENTVYVLNVQLLRSNDGGRTFQNVPVGHGDTHDLWIDPDDSQHVVLGDDGGAEITYNAGRTWSTILNQPTGQFYRVITDDRTPYWIYGAQQDNSTIAIPSRSRGFNITEADWRDAGGCESGWIAPKPGDPDVTFAGCYGGSISRYDHRTGQSREIVAWPQNAIGQAPKDLKYRFQWNAPILISPHDPSTLYHAAQVLLRSRDEGQSWEEMSPDLTRNDKAKQESSGGPITRDNTSVETYCTIFAVVESPHEAGTIWAGTDDGLVQITRDAGKTWQNVTPKGIPDWIQINSIEVSPHDKATAYVAATMYKHDDYQPYLYKTTDYGKSWKKIVRGIPATAFTRVVREDQNRRGLLYAGTETGLYASLDDGENWQPLQLNLPVVPITDLAVKHKDLIVATQGRAFWVLDDLTPLHEYRDELLAGRLAVFTPRPALRMDGGSAGEVGSQAFNGQNPPNGAVVSFWLKEKIGEKEKLTVEFLEGDKVLRTYSSERKPGPPPPDDEKADVLPLDAKPGLNRVVWNMRIPEARLVPNAVIWGNSAGPRVAPGTYMVRFTLGDVVVTKPVEVRPNPNVVVSASDLKAQFDLLRDARDGLSTTHEAVKTIREVRTQTQGVVARAKRINKLGTLEEKAKAINDKLSEVEKKLVNPDIKASQDVLNFPPALDHQFAGLASVVSGVDARPTDASFVFYRETKARLDAILAEMNAVLDTNLAEFNRTTRELDIPPVVVKR